MGVRSTLRTRRMASSVAVVGLTLAISGIAVAAGVVTGVPIVTIEPNKADQVTNIDVLRQQLKNYYGDKAASTGSSPSGGWTHELKLDSNYALEAEGVAGDGEHWLAARADAPLSGQKAIVLDVDDTTLTTWDYELFSNWDFNPGTNANFVGLTTTPGTPPVTTFTGNIFPATPGMVDLVKQAADEGYAIFFITGRGDAQHQATIANLVSDTAAGFTDLTTVTLNGATVPEVDAGYPAPTAVDIGHGGFTDGLFTKPAIGSYPTYLDKPEFCKAAIAAQASCPTIAYKSGTRAYIESLGYEIVANFGDQFSDLIGGFADNTFKMPNPNYFLP